MSLMQRNKEINKYHDNLYENILFLTMIYPTSKEFKAVFKKDMFVKNNKAAFHHVIHYLLTILNPSKIKEKVPSWPLYEIKMESQFRSEIMKYVNELNTIYEDADIPTIMPSHLISPGGPKFVKFMFKLSQLMIYNHIRNIEEMNLLFRIKQSKSKDSTKDNMKRLNIITEEISQKSKETKTKFETTLMEYGKEAKSIEDEILRLKRTLPDLRVKLVELESRDIIAPNIEHYKGEIDVLRNKTLEIEQITQKFETGSGLVKYLLGKDSCLEYQAHEFKIPKEISHIINSNASSLHIINLLQGFIQFIEQKLFDIRQVSTREVENSYELFSNLLLELTGLSSNMDYLKTQFNTLLSNLNKFGGKAYVGSARRQIVPIRVDEVSDSMDTILATPLEDCPFFEL